jgi:hypothetical protein
MLKRNTEKVWGQSTLNTKYNTIVSLVSFLLSKLSARIVSGVGIADH